MTAPKRVLLAAILLASACSTFGTDDAEPPPDTASDAGNDTATVDAPAPTPDAAEAGEAGPPCAEANQITETLLPEADALIGAGAPNQNRGNSGACNMAVGRCVMRFAPSGAAITALRAARGVAMTLQLRRADTFIECGGNNCATPGFRQDGRLSVHPLRTDWDEGVVTWKDRKSGGAAWGTAGALMRVVDEGDVAGELAVLAATTSPAVTLDVSRWT
ncbi:MAG TPA: hypothetical protein VLT33_34070, partial [Labilithrix sp.]|nr:hypothetical protein [Labilithrix sp.]